MEIGDLLLIIALVIVGLLALAYVVFGLGGRSDKQYLLTCPPCRANLPATTAEPVPVVMASKPTTPSLAVVPLLPLAPTATNLNLSATDTILFRNRGNGKYLSVCSGCTTLDPLAITASNSSPSISYSQWGLIPSNGGYLLSTKFIAPGSTQTAGVVQLLPASEIAVIKPQGNIFFLTPVDSRGYKLTTATAALKVCCSAAAASTSTVSCACPQFSSDSEEGVTLISAASPFDATAIWEVFRYSEGLGVQSVLN